MTGAMDWKAILALAVLVTPVAYCQSAEEAAKREVQIECLKLGGEWTLGWYGNCTLPTAP